MANNIKKKEWVVEEMDLKPFMNLMVVLIPLLLVSAEFAKIATIDISLPKGARGSQTQTTEASKPPEEDNKLILTVLLADSAMTIGAKSGFMPSIFYKEYHDYISRSDPSAQLRGVEYDPEKLDRKTMTYSDMPVNPKTGEKFTVHEREDIDLIAFETDDNNNFTKPIKALYSKADNELITNKVGDPLTEIKAGDVVYALATRMSPSVMIPLEPGADTTEINARRIFTVEDPSLYEVRNLSAYDLLKSMLVQIRDRYQDAEDRDDLIIAAENQIIYDKIIQIMDASRGANLSNISIAKLRT